MSINSYNNNYNLKEVMSNQTKIVDNLTKSFNGNFTKDNNIYTIAIDNGERIYITNDAKIQYITFSSQILFQKDDYVLNEQGKQVIAKFGEVIKMNLSDIKEIQIQGHADNRKSSKFATNMELASYRAMAVFSFLQNDSGIDPTKTVMSTSSFGEYMPVNRDREDFSYDSNKLALDNSDENKRSLNRRIEILLFYK